MRLYRPVGFREFLLISESGWRAFPPRLPEQPIFYPVLEHSYAEQIARDWNTKDKASGYRGFFTEFDIDDEFAARYEVHVVGDNTHRELWIPAEELEEFNRHIVGQIRVVANYLGRPERDEVLAHKSAGNHREEVESSDICGCFYCCNTFKPSEIVEWVDRGTTALCPMCGIDSVIGSASGWPIHDVFLRQMQTRWFN